MQMNEKTKNLLVKIGIVVLAAVAGVWALMSAPDHIEDTNGTDNFAIQTITDEQIINRSIGARGGPDISRNILTGNALTFSAKKYTGVSEIFYDNFLLPSDFEVNP